MPRIRGRLSGGRVRWVVGSGLAVAFCVQCHSLVSRLNQPSRAPGFGVAIAVARPETAAVDTGSGRSDPIEQMARTAPLKLLQEAQRRYRQNVIDYTCTFRKQENLDGTLTDIRTIEAKFRVRSQSVYMHWTDNPGKARRVIYVEGKWTKKGRPAALCEPAGAIARALVRSILMPIHGDTARAASRRTIDEFGFAKALELIAKYSLMAKQRGELKLRFVGEAVVDNRPTYVFERTLPYTGEKGEYPDRVLVYHLDQETLLPVMCASYADSDKQELLGRYEYTNVKLNVGLTDADFEGETYGL